MTTARPFRLTKQRSRVLAAIALREQAGKETCTADVVRATWDGPGHAATYAVVMGLVRAGKLTVTRQGRRKLLALTSEPQVTP